MSQQQQRQQQHEYVVQQILMDGDWLVGRYDTLEEAKEVVIKHMPYNDPSTYHDSFGWAFQCDNPDRIIVVDDIAGDTAIITKLEKGKTLWK